MSHPLDRPVWSALTTGWAHLAVGEPDHALRLHPDYGPFAAARDGSPESLAALATLLPKEGGVALIAPDPPRGVPGALETLREPIVQMEWAGGPAPDASEEGYLKLGDDDAAEMLALATLTQPGPFARHTHRLAQFLGVRDGDGRLVAMAGERMRVPGYAELSGVCTHPDARGRGLAGALSRTVTARILARGETPILHAWSSNVAAIRLYEALGYRLRAELTAVFIARA